MIVAALAELVMHILEMTRDQCWAALENARFGRLGCALDNEPYVVPVAFAVASQVIYSFSMPGKKIDWMRTNARICLEVDEVRSFDDWRSVVAQGTFEELSTTEDREHAHTVLQQRATWWEPGAVSRDGVNLVLQANPVYFVLRVGQLTGYIATPS